MPVRIPLIIILLFYAAIDVFSQAGDSAVVHKTRQWTLTDDYTTETLTDPDTSFALLHRYRKTDKLSPFNAFTGNYGQPVYQINFFDRINDPPRFLYRHYHAYMFTPYNPVFMNTRVPFTEIVFTYAGPREMADQTFRIRHSQNVNRFLNFGLIYDIVNSLGQYSYQKTDNKNFTFHISYSGEKYKFYFSAGLNTILNNENGGITDVTQLQSFEPRDVEVKLGSLSRARTLLKNNNILLVQRYAPGNAGINRDSLKANNSPYLRGFLTHIFIIEGTRRTYSDNYPMSGFYDTAYINSTETYDSLSERSIKNTLRFDFSTNPARKFRLGGGVGIGHEIFRYSQIIPSELSPPSDTSLRKEYNLLLKGLLFNDIGDNLRWKASGQLFLAGFRAGDFRAEGEIIKKFGKGADPPSWNIYGSFSSEKPSYWLYYWGSNHFKWENDFLKIFRVDAGTKLSVPSRHFIIRGDYAIIDNYTWFGPDTVPYQHGGGLSVASVMIQKEFSAWRLHLSNQLLIQKTSNREVLDLPLITLRSAGYFEHNFRFRLTKGSINTRAGVEIFYNTGYFGYNYNPSTGVYFNQSAVTTGNYPMLTAFFNASLKRTRIFLALEHFNSGLTGYNYFMVPGYPLNIRTFRYGIAWTFYD